MTDLRYPVGRFSFDPAVTPGGRAALVRQIAEAPDGLRGAAGTLTEAQLATPYRPRGWTVRQVVHHVADSHMNAYIRFKLALTEDTPTIKPYDETAWALIADTAQTPIDVSLTLLDALHRRWVVLLTSLNAPDFTRGLVHPEVGPITLDWMLQLYAWHGRHHTAHVTALKTREGWA